MSLTTYVQVKVIGAMSPVVNIFLYFYNRHNATDIISTLVWSQSKSVNFCIVYVLNHYTCTIHVSLYPWLEFPPFSDLTTFWFLVPPSIPSLLSSLLLFPSHMLLLTVFQYLPYVITRITKIEIVQHCRRLSQEVAITNSWSSKIWTTFQSWFASRACPPSAFISRRGI